jgi:Zn-dependent alcohol dehydrogenase
MGSVPTMSAVVCDRYGPPEVLRVCQVPTPSPKPDEVRVRFTLHGCRAADKGPRSLDNAARSPGSGGPIRGLLYWGPESSGRFV